ncbi:hypothetical protein VTL71DRAFT_13684 [Oculimacula yallundae]|uniref:Rhodopsin domain-containing protein n=1 Tax=Oculimacula yallundae TaxID=86028 RepID=A0ABR4CN16_9HELO
MTGSNTKGAATIATSVVFFFFAAVSVVCRIVARFGYLKNPGSDDVVIVIALITCFILIVTTGFEVKHGLGKHDGEVTPAELSEMMRYLWFAIIMYNLSLASIKISMVLQYLRVFPGKSIRFWCWMTIGLISAYGIQATITTVLSCVPVGTFWKGGGTCINKKFMWFFNAGFNILTDLIILALPIPVLSSLKLPAKQKIGLMFVFALGGFVCLVSILRLHSLYVFSTTTDATYDNANIAIWSNIEVTTGIICASMPATRSLISRFFPRFMSTNHSGRQTTPSQSHSHTILGTMNHSKPVRLTDVDSDHKTVTVVECGNERERDLERASLGDDNGRDIFVTTSMTQGVERKKGTEKDLVFRLG